MMNTINIPSERLRVFISSAQNNEDGFAWIEVRKRIKKHLQECPYLNPFIIEDGASATPSNQFFQRQVEKADVIVLLVKGEVRKGTSIEYALATKLSKPLLVYFLEDSIKSLSVEKLKKKIQSTDYCTYHPMKSFDDIETNVRNEIIEDVIRYYQDMPFHRTPSEDTPNNVEISEDVEPSKLSTPNKTTMKLFSSCYNYLFKALDIDLVESEDINGESTLHMLGESLLKWLITGEGIDCDEEILKLAENITDVYKNTDWLLKRWDAVRYEISGNISKALQAEQEALSLAKDARLPKWIINDILIDCRNIENEVYQSNGKIVLESDAQKELNESDTIVYLPVIDRYLGNVYDEIVREEFRTDTASRNTTLFGTNIRGVLNNIGNYFFSAAIYGSYTHLLITRGILSTALQKYARLIDENSLIFECVKLYILQGSAKNYKLFLNQQWDTVYSFVTSYADDMWHLADKAPFINRDAIKQAVVETVGLYLSDSAFSGVEQYLCGFAKEIYWGNSEAYFDCIFKNINRLNQNSIVNVLAEIIHEKRFHIGSTVSRIILSLDLANVSIDNQRNLKAALSEQLPFIVNNGGSPQLIAALVKQNNSVFADLETLPNNGLTDIEQKFYKINLGVENWTSILDDEIKTAQKQFKVNSKPGAYSQFATNPYSIIGKIVRDADDAQVDDISIILSEKFIPLAVEVINSDAAVPTKESCVACLCDVLLFFICHNIKIKASIIDALRNIDIKKGTEFSAVKSREMLAIRTFMAKLIIDIADKNDLLLWCVEFNKRTINERLALADCIEKYLYHHSSNPTDIDLMILSIVFQCFEDEQYEVRCIACRCLIYILQSEYKHIVENKLYQAATDPSHFVRNNLLRLCKNGAIKGDTSKKLIDIFKKDANYVIRTFASS